MKGPREQPNRQTDRWGSPGEGVRSPSDKPTVRPINEHTQRTLYWFLRSYKSDIQWEVLMEKIDHNNQIEHSRETDSAESRRKVTKHLLLIF